MRELQRRLARQAMPLLIAFASTGLLAGAEPVQKVLASLVAPEYVRPPDEVLLERARESCKKRNWMDEYFGRNSCDFSEPGRKTLELHEQAVAAYRFYEREHLESKMDFISEAGAIGSALLAFALAIVVTRNLYRFVKENGMPSLPGKAGNFFKALASRKAERDFMRYKRLFDNGLLSEEEFEKKKRELKPKILQGSL